MCCWPWHSEKDRPTQKHFNIQEANIPHKLRLWYIFWKLLDSPPRHSDHVQTLCWMQPGRSPSTTPTLRTSRFFAAEAGRRQTLQTSTDMNTRNREYPILDCHIQGCLVQSALYIRLLCNDVHRKGYGMSVLRLIWNVHGAQSHETQCTAHVGCVVYLCCNPDALCELCIPASIGSCRLWIYYHLALLTPSLSAWACHTLNVNYEQSTETRRTLER